MYAVDFQRKVGILCLISILFHHEDAGSMVAAARELARRPNDEMAFQAGRRGLFATLHDTRYVSYKNKKDCYAACQKMKPAGKYSAIDAGTFPSSGSKKNGPTMCRVKYDMTCNGEKSLSLYGKVEDGYCRALAGFASKMYEDFDCVCALKTLDIAWKTVTQGSTTYCPIGWSLFTFNRNKYLCNANGTSKCAICRDPSSGKEQYSFGYIWEFLSMDHDSDGSSDESSTCGKSMRNTEYRNTAETMGTCFSADNYFVSVADTKDMAVLCERNS